MLAIARKERPQRLRTHELLQYMKADLFNIDEFERRIQDRGLYDAFLHFAWDGSVGDK